MAALAHPVRLQILRELSAAECCCKDVVGRFDLAQSTISQHLRVLVDAGLLRVRHRAQRSHYAVDAASLRALSEHISSLSALCCAGFVSCHTDEREA
jgi:DNA-binding transcriptional ArsR family regulator